MPDYFAKSKACYSYYEAFGDSGEEFGETTRRSMKDSGDIMRSAGRYYEVSGEGAGLSPALAVDKMG